MELVLLLSFSSVILLTINVHGAAIEAPLDVITLDDLSQSDRDYLTYLEQKAIRDKRSGDILGLLKSKIANGIKSKISHIASASAHLSSSKGHHHDHYYEHPPESHDEKSFDFWDLQKSILNTLLQAVKAIKGGLIAVKGHLIKGGGYLISAKGKLISAKGEAITSLGKHIASSAILSPRPSHHSAPSGPSHDYGPPPSGSGYSAPSGHGVEYHSPPHGPSPSGYGDHKYPPSIEAYKDHLPHGGQQGILILKKIPKGHGNSHNGNDGAHNPSPDAHTISDSAPEEPSVPPFTYLPDVKDILSASKGHDDAPPSAPPSPSAPSAPSDYSTSHSSSHHHDDHPNHHHDDHPSHHHDVHPNHHHDDHPKYHHDDHPSHHHVDHPSHHHYDAPPPSYETPPSHHSFPPNYDSPSGPPPPPEHNIPPTATSYGKPIEIPNSFPTDHFNNHVSSYNPHSDLFGHHQNGHMQSFENFDSLHLPSSHQPSSLSLGLNGFPTKYPHSTQGFEHFSKFPTMDLSSNIYGSKFNLGPPFSPYKKHSTYSVHESPDLDSSASEPKLMIPSPKSLRDPQFLHKFASKLANNPNLLKKYVTAYNALQRIQSSYTRTISRQKRPQNHDPVRSLAFHIGRRDSVRI